MWATLNRYKGSGFTIVELLIVIVVIAILAAITIVAYNGIQDRARTTQTAASIEAYAKGLMQYATDNSTYPVSHGCLGAASKCINVANNGAVCFSLGGASDYAAFDTMMNQYLGSNLPAPSSATYGCGSGGQYGGAYYYSADGQSAYIYAFLKRGTDCPTVGGAKLQVSTTTDGTQYCRYIMPALS